MDTAIPARIAAYMRASAGRRPGHRVGPFSVGLDARSDHPMRNYAVPDSGALPSPGEITALIAFFRSHGRVPRLEYVEDSAPGVWPALALAGFGLEARLPVMAATAETSLTAPVPEGITLQSAVDDGDLLSAVTVQQRAYDEPEAPQDVARLSRLVNRGGIVAIGVDSGSGRAISSGLVDVSGDYPGVGELAAVGTEVAFRRRGIAAALSVFLARTAHAAGIGLVFLEAEPTEEEIYRRVGFTDATTKLWASLR